MPTEDGLGYDFSYVVYIEMGLETGSDYNNGSRDMSRTITEPFKLQFLTEELGWVECRVHYIRMMSELPEKMMEISYSLKCMDGGWAEPETEVIPCSIASHYFNENLRVVDSDQERTIAC